MKVDPRIVEMFQPPRTAASAALHSRAAELFARSRRLPRSGAEATRERSSAEVEDDEALADVFM